MPPLHHLALGAVDVERMARFYSTVVGLHEVARRHRDDGSLRSIWLRLGEGVLMIEQTEQERKHVEGVGAGYFLLAVSVAPSERGDWEAKLASAGVEVESRGEHTLYFRDPEGNRVAVSSYPLAK